MSLGTLEANVAVCILLRKQDKLAFVLRENTSWMAGYYGLPGGKVEKNESVLTAACREAQEETGVVIQPEALRLLLTVQRHKNKESDYDWIDLFFEASEWEGEPYNAEPHMHSELAWFDLNDLPANVIPAVRFQLERITAGDVFAEYGQAK